MFGTSHCVSLVAKRKFSAKEFLKCREKSADKLNRVNIQIPRRSRISNYKQKEEPMKIIPEETLEYGGRRKMAMQE